MNEEILRILDANLNRLREGLRVAEDYARFALDDANVAEQIKRMRHDVRSIVESLGSDALLAARDVTGDVGVNIKTAAESSRADSADVARAALARASEAARVIGEFAKVISAAASACAERLRYRIYDVQPALLIRDERRRRTRELALYVIVTESLCARPWRETAAAALRGGAGCLQLREKSLNDAELLRRARELRALTSAHNALLMINDRPDIARLCGADGVHVGQDDLSVADVRKIVGGALLVGKSTHSVEQVRAASEECPDYIAVGPIFASATKPQPRLAGLETLRQAATLTDIPLVAIGGITLENAHEVRRAARATICACSAVIQTHDAEHAARGILLAVASGGESADAIHLSAASRPGVKRA